MAQGISLISGSPLIGSPIVYRVTPAAYNSNRTFHRIMVRVYAALESDADYTTFDFSTPVEIKLVNGSYATQPATFDISSALQAVADKYEYAATPPTRYPYIKFRVEAFDEWMVNGSIFSEQGVVKWPFNSNTAYTFYAYAFMGAWTDLERMKAGVDGNGVEFLNVTYLSRKPNSSPEIVFKDAPFIYPASFGDDSSDDSSDDEDDGRSILDTDHMSDDASPVFVSGAPNNGPKSLSHTPTTVGAAIVGSHSIYVINAPADAYLLRFINGMGCMESLHVQSLVKREVPITTDKHTVAKQETLKRFSRSVVRKSNDRETWYLTSGPLDREWASWYVHEFLMSEQVWIGLNSSLFTLHSSLTWIPCHVVPEETTMLEDLTKAQPYEVQFRLEMDINGSPL